MGITTGGLVKRNANGINSGVVLNPSSVFSTLSKIYPHVVRNGLLNIGRVFRISDAPGCARDICRRRARIQWPLTSPIKQRGSVCTGTSETGTSTDIFGTCPVNSDGVPAIADIGGVVHPSRCGSKSVEYRVSRWSAFFDWSRNTSSPIFHERVSSGFGMSLSD